MFRLPLCPHCGTVYHYKDTKKAARDKHHTCYHCHKEFRATLFPGVIVIGGIMLILCIGTNLLLLSRMNALNLILLFGATIIYILLCYVLIPFFVRFVKDDRDERKRR